MKKNKAFTLIELIAVLVIMAILALIVTPLVMNIIRKARISADKRSIDAYGRSIELAIASYLLDNGYFPTSIEQLTIEYSGDEVVCSTTKLKSDSSVYLAECTVGGRVVDGYTYGSEEAVVYDEYQVGDEIIYKGMKFYVVSSSGTSEDRVTVLKETPLKIDEVSTYGMAHINSYTYMSQGTTYDKNGYGGMAYYSTETCGFPSGSYESVKTGCTTDYEESDIKYVIDAWANDRLTVSDLKADSLGYKARLLTYEELITSLGYNPPAENTNYMNLNTEDTPSWVYNSNYYYWTMSSSSNKNDEVWAVNAYGSIEYGLVWYNFGYVVRPVITISKSVL